MRVKGTTHINRRTINSLWPAYISCLPARGQFRPQQKRDSSLSNQSKRSRQVTTIFLASAYLPNSENAARFMRVYRRGIYQPLYIYTNMYIYGVSNIFPLKSSLYTLLL